MKTQMLLPMSLLLVLWGCIKQKTETTESAAPVQVSTVKAVEQSYSQVLSFPGTVNAGKEACLGAALPGRVEKVFFREGQSVKEGGLIAQLSDEMLIQAEIEYNALKKDYERLNRLSEKGSVSQMDFDHIKARYEASEAKVQLMRKNTEIRAPFSGTIVDILVKEGENYSFVPSIDKDLSVHSGIIRLMQLDPVKVKIDVGEKDLPSINPGMKASIELDAWPGKTFTGKVMEIKPVMSGVSRTATAEIEVSNASRLMKPGMYARTTIGLPEKKGVMVPVTAVFRQPGTADDYVFVISDNVASRVKVEKIQQAGDMQVVSGLEAGAEVAVSGKNSLSNGTRVEIKNN